MQWWSVWRSPSTNTSVFNDGTHGDDDIINRSRAEKDMNVRMAAIRKQRPNESSVLNKERLCLSFGPVCSDLLPFSQDATLSPT
jgi:hypothetical protein